jgi:hypothetical protein
LVGYCTLPAYEVHCAVVTQLQNSECEIEIHAVGGFDSVADQTLKLGMPN